MYERMTHRQTQNSKKNEGGELCTDRDFLRNAIHTVGGDRGERKGDFLDGGSRVGKFFVDLRRSLGNLG